jgi:predicted GIY-YIG superfamily endonuclease
MSERTAVYRLFDTEDDLLYIGVSDQFGARWHQHAKVQPWWRDVDHQTITWFDTRDEALATETAAIKAEQPLYNIVHNGQHGRPGSAKDAVTGFMIPEDPRDVEVWRSAEALRAAEKAHQIAQEEHVSCVLAALRAGRGPTAVVNLSPFTDAHIRKLARAAGIPPARRGGA